MNLDYFVYLDQQSSVESTPLPWGYIIGWVDHVSAKVFALEIERALAEEQGDRNQARDLRRQIVEIRENYRKRADKQIPVRCFPFASINFSFLPSPDWLGLQVDFELLTSWHSRDDRVFHVLDNPVRKDKVFGVPFMAAASWKGMLRWACRMQAGLLQFLEEGKSFEREWRDPDWILHLFGNEKGEKEDFHQGALVFYATWFDRIGFEVINPHSRARRAGTQPIYYEVVPPGARGIFSLLYAPWPGMKPKVDRNEALPKLLEAIETLLTEYGISAKRTVGWGTARILEWRAYRKDATMLVCHEPSDEELRNGKSWQSFWQEIESSERSGRDAL